jgi:myo-inositol-1(or 4)-monophosphatase
MKQFVIDTVSAAGQLLRDRFGQVQNIRRKENVSSIVTETDLASEALILERIRHQFPNHNIIAEESGFDDRGSDWTWVIDPLDGTSNYAAGIPWYGVMMAVLRGATPIVGAMFLPHDQSFYLAEAGKGATRNNHPIRVTAETQLEQVLLAYAVDASKDPRQIRKQARGFGQLLNHVRNVRATNCLIDFALTIDGRLGGFVNHSTRVWDVAAAALVLQEAGGQMTNLDGKPLNFSPGPDVCERNYAVMGANPVLLSQLVELLASVS